MGVYITQKHIAETHLQTTLDQNVQIQNKGSGTTAQKNQENVSHLISTQAR